MGLFLFLEVIIIRPRYLSEFFILNGIHSHILGVQGCYIINESNNVTPMPWMGAQSLVTGKLAGWDYPLTIKALKENLKFTLVFSIMDDKFVPEMNYNLGRVFGKSVPVPLEISTDQLKMAYVLPTNQREIYRYMGLKGHFAIDFEATTPYWLSQPEIIRNKVLHSGDIFVMNNQNNAQNSDGSYTVWPWLKFKVIQSINIISEKSNIVTQNIEQIITETGNYNMITEDSPRVTQTATTPTFELIHISNRQNPNRRIKFENLNWDETIEMNSRLFQIKSNTGLNRFPNWNREIFYLHDGYNKFQSVYDCIVETRIQYPLYQ